MRTARKSLQGHAKARALLLGGNPVGNGLFRIRGNYQSAHRTIYRPLLHDTGKLDILTRTQMSPQSPLAQTPGEHFQGVGAALFDRQQSGPKP